MREGPFRVSITEAGTLQAVRSLTYASSIQSNQAKITALAPEGKLVQKGDLLILFDAAPFEEEIRRNQALLAQAEAELAKAREDLKLQGLQNREELLAAQLRVEKSELELKDVQQGKGRVKEDEVAQAVANARARAAEGRDRARRPAPAAGGGLHHPHRARARRAAGGALARGAAARRAAPRRARGLRPAARAQPGPLRRAVEPRDAAAARERRLLSRGAEAGGDRRRRRAGSRRPASRLELAKQQLARCEVRAEVPGIVVYKDVFFGSEQRKPQVGDQVWANQPLVILPDISKMEVETRVRETDVHKVERNQKVAVRVEAYPDLRLSGTVTLVGTLAQEEKERRGTKFFSVRVQIQESEPRLRPGMTARVEIEVEERPQALFVPLEAVFEKDGRSVVYLAGRRPRAREVVLGPSNADFVVIEKGLARGERVLLRDPGRGAPDTSVAPGS